MLLVLLVWLLGLANASTRDFDYLVDQISTGSWGEFVRYLAACDIESSCGLEIIFKMGEQNFPCWALTAALDKFKSEKNFQINAVSMVINLGRLDVLAGLLEGGYQIFRSHSEVLASLPLKGMETVALFIENGADPKSFTAGTLDFLNVTLIFQYDHNEIFYYLAGQGADIYDDRLLGQVINNIKLREVQKCSPPHACEFAFFLLERVDELRHFAGMVAFAKQSASTVLIQRLLQEPQVRLYLQRVKCASRAILETCQQTLFKDFEAKITNESFTNQDFYQLVSRIKYEFHDEIAHLTEEGGDDAASLEPLTEQDLMLIFGLPSDLLSIVISCVLGMNLKSLEII